MSERQKQADFLKHLLANGDRPEHHELSGRLQQAEREERCLARACRLVVVVGLLALAVLGYLTVLRVPDDMTRLSQAALRFCQALALGSTLCLGVFSGLLLWHRALINRLFADTRKIITSEMQHQFQVTRSGFAKLLVQESDTAVYRVRTQSPAGVGSQAVTVTQTSSTDLEPLRH